MKKTLFLVLFLNLFFISSFPQTLDMNLKKYWMYRERLEKYFVVASENNEKGTNIPGMLLKYGTPKSNHPNKIFLKYGDGNGALQYYIGTLATEYKLLQLYNQDNSKTRNLLLCALKAVERLDLTAESYWRKNRKIDSANDLNGFFIRDDVPKQFLAKRGLKINGSFVQIQSTYSNDMEVDNHPYENSKDNVWHYLINLALVKHLVDDVEINEKAKEIAYRMVKFMHNKSYYNFFGKHFFDWWGIVNPITNELVEDGADVEEPIAESRGSWFKGVDLVGFKFGFAEAANWITGYEQFDESRNKHTIKNSSGETINLKMYNYNLHYANSNSKETKRIFFTNAMEYAPIFGFDIYSIRSLLTVSGASLKYYSTQDLYDYLVEYRDDSKFKYDHFPLIKTILHGSSGEFFDIFESEKKYYETLLNKASKYGAYNFGKTEKYGLPIRPDEWSSDNILVWPELLNRDAKKDLGYYSGLDYMLLFNLYWLVYQSKSFDGDSNAKSGEQENGIIYKKIIKEYDGPSLFQK